MKVDSIDQVLNLIKGGGLKEYVYENVELKRSWKVEHGAKASMLCNGIISGPSFLVIGVEDDGSLAGHDEKWLEKNLGIVSENFNQKLDPIISLEDMSTFDVEGSKIIVISLRNPGVVVKWGGRAWSGNGTTKKEMDASEILELNLKLPGLTDLTKRKVNYESSKELVKLFCDSGGVEFNSSVLEKNFLEDTRAGEILFGRVPFRIVKYDLNNDISSNETRYGLMQLLSDGFKSEVKSFYRSIDGNARVSDEIVREAVGNSVGHAAYHDRHGDIIIELFPSKFCISNLAYNEYISLANKWFSRAHKSPNPFLMEVLRLVRKVDELGRGKERLLKECLVNGFNPPSITITDAGRYKRWTLVVDFGHRSERYSKLLEAIQEQYADKEKALIAYALVLWRDKPFSEIAKYFDEAGSRLASEVLFDLDGPVFFYEERDSIVLHRWVKVLLEEGKTSKGFAPAEEEDLFKKCKQICTKYERSLITPKEFRKLAHLSTSNSDKTLSSTVLTKWEREGRLRKIRRGVYKFVEERKTEDPSQTIENLISLFAKNIEK